MKKLKLLGVLSGIVLLGFTLAGCNNNAGHGTAATGTVDMEKVMQSEVVMKLEKSMQAVNKGSQQAIQTAYLSLQKAQAAAKKATGKEKASLQAKAKIAQANFSKLLQKEQAAARVQQQALLQKIKVAIAATAKDMNLKSVLLTQAVLYHTDDTDKDITTDVIKKLGEQNKSAK